MFVGFPPSISEMDFYNHFDRGAEITIRLCSNKPTKNRSSKEDEKKGAPISGAPQTGNSAI